MKIIIRIIALALLIGMLLSLFAACKRKAPVEFEATYLGVKGYEAGDTNKDINEGYVYSFEKNGSEITYKVADINDYPIQNALKKGYVYRVTVEDGVVTAVTEITEGSDNDFVPRVCGVPGEKTLKNFLMTALEPVGTVLYIYGGGWDWQDVGSSEQARTLGVSSDWIKFFNEHDENYTYKDPDPAISYYPYNGYNEYYYAGLDCSGYLGWVIYNTFETENGNEGYVGLSTKFAKRLSDQGWGEWTQDIKAPDETNGYVMRPGDVMSINGHVWISLGTCSDGSVLIAHSTPSRSRANKPGGGVQISAVGSDKNCQAFVLAEKVMSEYYPRWFERYPALLSDPGLYFTFEGDDAGRFTWFTDGSSGGLTDPDQIQEMSPEEVLDVLFGENS